MKYIKPIICIVILLFNINVNAQRLTFSSELGYFNNDKNLSNIVAAAIIEYALQQGGEREVLRLFEVTNLDQLFELLNIANNERAEFIRSLF